MMSSFGASTGTNLLSPNDCNVPSPGNDGISSLRWSPTANFLVSSNWDGGVRCYEVQEQGGQIRCTPKAQVNHDQGFSVLDCCFSSDGSTVFSAGTDKAVRMWRLGETPPNNVAQQIGAHDAPVKSVRCLPSGLVVSGGWDRKLKFWDTRSPNPAGVLELPERFCDLDVQGNLMVAATTGRQILIYNVGGPTPIEHSRKESLLKFQTRCVSCFPDQTGYAVGGIEGRVCIQYVQKPPDKEQFAFKCHRQGNDAYAVNCIAFQKEFGTFATVGSDGVVNFWDKDNKQRLKVFPAVQRPIPCAAFSAQGNLFAFASSYDWGRGSQYHQPGTPNEIIIHYTHPEEIQPKKKQR